MSQATAIGSVEARFAALVAVLAEEPGVTPPARGGRRPFGSAALKVNNKVFAMVAQGRLVLKLPRIRVDELLASGDGERYDPRRDGRLMHEWVTVSTASTLDWLALAREALAFVGGLST